MKKGHHDKRACVQDVTGQSEVDFGCSGSELAWDGVIQSRMRCVGLGWVTSTWTELLRPRLPRPMFVGGLGCCGLWWLEWVLVEVREREKGKRERRKIEKRKEEDERKNGEEERRRRRKKKWVSSFETRIYIIFDFLKKVSFLIVLRQNFDF